MAPLAQAAPDVISARIEHASDALAARLAQRAAGLGKAWAENRLRARAADPWRWRDARLLWPLFTKD